MARHCRRRRHQRSPPQPQSSTSTLAGTSANGRSDEHVMIRMHIVLRAPQCVCVSMLAVHEDEFGCVCVYVVPRTNVQLNSNCRIRFTCMLRTCCASACDEVSSSSSSQQRRRHEIYRTRENMRKTRIYVKYIAHEMENSFLSCSLLDGKLSPINSTNTFLATLTTRATTN